MSQPVDLVEIWRGDMVECIHQGHAVVCDGAGQITDAWGDPHKVIYPRSSCKMVQALPLIESGAAAAFGLTVEQLALSCASHQGAAIHTDRVRPWLDHLGLEKAAILGTSRGGLIAMGLAATLKTRLWTTCTPIPRS